MAKKKIKKRKKLKKRKKQNKKRNYFQKFWDGDLSLPQSYWVVGVLISIPLGILLGVFTALIGASTNTIFVFLLPWYIFIIVGIWRSSDKYKGPKIWAILAKIAMVLSAIRVVSGMFAGA